MRLCLSSLQLFLNRFAGCQVFVVEEPCFVPLNYSGLLKRKTIGAISA